MRCFLTASLLLIGLGACAPDIPVDATATVTGRLVAGPTCPVETDPPDPACAARAMPGLEVVATLPDGTEVRELSDERGRFRLALPPGAFTITFGAVKSPMLAPDPIAGTIAADETLDLGDLSYDTGIR